MSETDTSAEAVERLILRAATSGTEETRRLVEATLRALLAERDALKAAIEEQRHTYHEAHIAMEAQRDAARAEAARLRVAGLDALATAVAAHSLLSRGGKRAAASDTMFLQMLSDYEASITRVRAALAAKEPGHE